MDRRQEMIDALDSQALRERVVRTLMFFRGADRSDAEDAVQDAYVLALRTKHPWDGQSKLSTWFTSVAINALKMRGRVAQRLKEREAVLDEALAIPGEHSPYERVVALEELALFEIALESLTFKSRRAILYLIANPDGTYRTISGKMGTTVGALKSQVHNVRKYLREVL